MPVHNPFPNSFSLCQKLGIFFRRYFRRFGKRLKKVTIIIKSAFYTGFTYCISLCQKLLCMRNSLGGNVFVNSSASSRFKEPAKVGGA